MLFYSLWQKTREINHYSKGWISRQWLINTLGRGGYLYSRII
jgi:hypothetical protein